jgi:hypothetical protein
MTKEQLIQTRYTLGILTGSFDYTLDCENFNPKFEGTVFENGDNCNGWVLWENQELRFVAISADGNEYSTTEMPYEVIDLTGSGLFVQNEKLCTEVKFY